MGFGTWVIYLRLFFVTLAFDFWEIQFPRLLTIGFKSKLVLLPSSRCTHHRKMWLIKCYFMTSRRVGFLHVFFSFSTWLYSTHILHRVPGTGSCFSLQLSNLGVPGEASQKAYKSSPPTAGVGAQEGAQEGHCSQTFGFGLFFVWAKPSLGSVTRNETTSHGAVKISAISWSSPRPPPRPP